MDLQFYHYQWNITWLLPIIFPGYVFFSAPFSPRNTETPACLTAVLRYLILLDLRLHAWVILRSETFIAWSPTSLLSEKWFLHKNQTAAEMRPGAKFRHLAKCAGILGVKHRMHLSERILDAPKKLWRLFEEASLFFFTDTSRSQKQCLCVVNKKTCRWQPLHVGYSECLVIQPAIKCALNPQNKEIFGSYHTWNAQKM